MAKYKVWVEIEELTDDGEPTEEPTLLPDSLGVFGSLSEATERQWEVVQAFGPDPERSDAKPR